MSKMFDVPKPSLFFEKSAEGGCGKIFFMIDRKIEIGERLPVRVGLVPEGYGIDAFFA